MKTLRKGGGGALNAVGTVRSFMSVVKEIDFEDARARAETPPTILVTAPTQERADEAYAMLFSSDTSGRVEVRAWVNQASVSHDRWYVVIVSDPDGTGLLDKVRGNFDEVDRQAVFYIGDGGEPEAEALRGEITDAMPSLAPAIGRYFEQWRPAAVRAIID